MGTEIPLLKRENSKGENTTKGILGMCISLLALRLYSLEAITFHYSGAF